MADEQAKKTYTVFIIDDDQFLLNMYSVKFKSSGFEVKTASSPRQALSDLENGLSADVVLFDVVMPGQDGLEMVAAIKKKGFLKQALFIALTNQGQAADIERAKRVGVNGYIVKASSIPSEVVSEVLRLLKENGK
jgi:CheY-like chemotaxis protein